MKDVFAVFDQNLDIMSEMISSNNFYGCFFTAHNMITYSYMVEYDDGIIIGEILESIFNEIGQLIERYQCNEEYVDEIRDNIINFLQDLKIKYKEPNKNDLFIILKNFRSLATNFQFECWKFNKKSPDDLSLDNY